MSKEYDLYDSAYSSKHIGNVVAYTDFLFIRKE